jgi:hypothetical protein
MTVQECIDAYLELSKEIFNVDQVLNETIPVGDDQCRFDYKVLEKSIKDIIKSRLGSENFGMSESIKLPHHSCRTFVIAKKALQADGPPTVFRSYSGEGVRPSKCAIWQAARATTATPLFFKAMYIDSPRPGVNYVDGGLGHNNPAKLSLDEARRIWGPSKSFCLVSLGTGRQKAVRVGQFDHIHDINTQRSLFEHVKDFVPDLVSNFPGWKTATNFPAGVMSVINMANALSKMAFNSEQVHQGLSKDLNKQFPYYRFNVERDVGDIGLGDWRREEEIAVHTESYLQEHEGEERKSLCVLSLLRNNHKSRPTELRPGSKPLD